jgi:hypothetical protein
VRRAKAAPLTPAGKTFVRDRFVKGAFSLALPKEKAGQKERLVVGDKIQQITFTQTIKTI